MKIYSDYQELEGRVFSTVKECRAAEAEVEAAREVLATKADTSKKKKALADAIAQADAAVTEAYADYETAKEQVRKILEETNNQMENILTPAKAKVKEAEQRRVDAIKAYTDNYGCYQSVYTGERAEKELERFSRQFNSTFADIVNAFLR